MLTSQLFAGDPILEAVAADQDRISRTQNRKGEHVRKVQQVLLLRNPGALPQFGADGSYGNESAAAVREFKINELGVPEAEVIDDVGPRTVIRLDEIQAAAEQPVPPPPPPTPPPTTTFVRRDIWTLQTDANWNPIVLAYAKAVQVMQSRPISDPTSWQFQGAVHGSFSPVTARRPLERLPARQLVLPAVAPDVPLRFRNHRPPDRRQPGWAGRLRIAVLELRASLRPRHDAGPVPARDAAGRDAEPASGSVRPAGIPDWDIGRRILPNQASSAAAMAHLTFSGPPATGFGGPRSTPTQFNGAFGALESTPHNPVHPQVGGRQVDPCAGGLMTDPRCAALDPIFWLHHANIDRLWNRWIDLGGGRRIQVTPPGWDSPSSSTTQAGTRSRWPARRWWTASTSCSTSTTTRPPR